MDCGNDLQDRVYCEQIRDLEKLRPKQRLVNTWTDVKPKVSMEQ